MEFYVLLSYGAGAVALLIIGWIIYDFIRIEREYSEEVLEGEAFADLGEKEE
ncbi:MAG: hypothetical protein ACXQS2_05760 [Methermicoccaceae archaeon]